MSQLTPPSAPIGIFPAFIAQRPETLVLKSHFINGKFDVSTLGGTPLLSVKAESASLSHRKHVFDIQGTHLCTILRETWTIPGVSFLLTQGVHYLLSQR